ncbi:alpha-methylacyl-CoA racemase [Actinocorallia herbida]|uniref:Alpha-methylacyl-CoA racemase n=1 Tax=Actinocorallia herbida TaxID=58109 RepID=A0A3N1D2U2_9ACTN|nr:CaiB/BaiF CoA-transferase family protein [Actinocorallia herbida]ROO87855.1 alpha-methylacyl-CoA racemase [Actinocorallia herbida]
MTAGSTGRGPLTGLRVVELAGIGPAPFAAMMLGDLGANVIRIDRPGGHAGNPVPPKLDLLNRNRRSIELDLKNPADLDVARTLLTSADVLIEGYRPGVAERLGLGPEDCHAVNPRLVYARMTGWGQTGPLADRAGHDINYISRVGALEPIGPREGTPVIPLNIVGDFGGGGMLLAFGLLAAVHHATRTGEGQVVDAAITDGTALLTTMLHTWRAAGLWIDRRAANMLDGGAHFYNVYATADGRFLSVGAIEPRFYRAFLNGLGVPFESDWITSHDDAGLWPAMRSRISEIIQCRTLEEWLAIFEGTDACVSPVLTPAEALTDAHNRARATFIDVDGVPQPAPAPRFDRTPPAHPRRQPVPGEHGDEIRSALLGGNPWRRNPGAAAGERKDHHG